MKLESKFPSPILSDNYVFILGDGIDIPFWNAKWMNMGRLSDIFPILFNASTVEGGSAKSMGVRIGADWVGGSFGIDSRNQVLTQDSTLRGLIANVGPIASGADLL